jgi:molybdopterin synthase sulfur carrier subunit
MKITVLAFAGFREIIGERLVLDLPEDSTLAGLLASLASRSAETREALFDEQGVLKGHVIVTLNKKRQSRTDLEKQQLSPGDEVAIYPPVAGG